MTRMKNETTGAVVNVSPEKAKRLGPDWSSAEKAKRTKKTDEKSDS